MCCSNNNRKKKLQCFHKLYSVVMYLKLYIHLYFLPSVCIFEQTLLQFGLSAYFHYIQSCLHQSVESYHFRVLGIFSSQHTSHIKIPKYVIDLQGFYVQDMLISTVLFFFVCGYQFKISRNRGTNFLPKNQVFVYMLNYEGSTLKQTVFC